MQNCKRAKEAALTPWLHVIIKMVKFNTNYLLGQSGYPAGRHLPDHYFSITHSAGRRCSGYVNYKLKTSTYTETTKQKKKFERFKYWCTGANAWRKVPLQLLCRAEGNTITSFKRVLKILKIWSMWIHQQGERFNQYK